MKTVDILKRMQKERERYEKALSAATTEEERKFLLDEHVFFMAHLGTDKENRESFGHPSYWRNDSKGCIMGSRSIEI